MPIVFDRDTGAELTLAQLEGKADAGQQARSEQRQERQFAENTRRYEEGRADRRQSHLENLEQRREQMTFSHSLRSEAQRIAEDNQRRRDELARQKQIQDAARDTVRARNEADKNAYDYNYKTKKIEYDAQQKEADRVNKLALESQKHQNQMRLKAFEADAKRIEKAYEAEIKQLGRSQRFEWFADSLGEQMRVDGFAEADIASAAQAFADGASASEAIHNVSKQLQHQKEMFDELNGVFTPEPPDDADSRQIITMLDQGGPTQVAQYVSEIREMVDQGTMPAYKQTALLSDLRAGYEYYRDYLAGTPGHIDRDQMPDWDILVMSEDELNALVEQELEAGEAKLDPQGE